MSWINDINKKLKEQRDNYAESLENGEAISRRNKIAAASVSDETRIKAGKAAGKANVESGHWQSIKTPEHQSKAASVAGKKNVESGHWQECIELGAQATSDKFKQQRYDRIYAIYELMEFDKEYQTRDIREFAKSLDMKEGHYIKSLTSCEFPELIGKIKGPKSTSPSKYYKKKGDQ